MSRRDKAPVFVVGSARSGNTMLYHMLVSSGEFPVYRTEPVVFDLLAPRFGDFRNEATRQKMLRYWLRSRQFRRCGVDAATITEKIMKQVSTPGDFLRVVMDEMARAAGYQRWAVWGPDNLLHIAAIKRQIPEAIFIHVVRDGRDVAYALDRKKFIAPLPWDRSQRLFVSALHWMWKVQRGRRDGRTLGGDYIEVRFEDLVLKPEETLAAIGSFIGQELDYERIRHSEIGAVGRPNTSFVEELSAARFSPVGRWRRQLAPEKVALLEGLVGDALVEFGYELAQPATEIGTRLRTMRKLYPAFYELKEWLKSNTPVGRFVNMNRLHLDEVEPMAELVVGRFSGVGLQGRGVTRGWSRGPSTPRDDSLRSSSRSAQGDTGKAIIEQ